MIILGKKGTLHLLNGKTSIMLCEDEKKRLFLLYSGPDLGKDGEKYIDALMPQRRELFSNLIETNPKSGLSFHVTDKKKLNGLINYEKSYFPFLQLKGETLEITALEDAGEIELAMAITSYLDYDAFSVKIRIRNRGKRKIDISDISPFPIQSDTFINAGGRNWEIGEIQNLVLEDDAPFSSSLSYITACSREKYVKAFLLSFGAKKVRIKDGEVFLSQSSAYYPLTLDAGESFITPELMLFFGESEEKATDTVRQALRTAEKGNGKNMFRPLMISTRESFGLSIDERKIRKMAEHGKAMGFEGILIDEGWFSSRKSKDEGLGDWKIDTMKFPSGLKALGEEIHLSSLLFGLWVDLITVNRRSLYCSMKGKNLLGEECDDNLILDLRKNEVREELFISLSSLIEIGKLDYLKLTIPNSLPHIQSEANLLLDLQRGIYLLLERIRNTYPNLYISMESDDPSLSLYASVLEETNPESDQYYFPEKISRRVKGNDKILLTFTPIYTGNIISLSHDEENNVNEFTSFTKERRKMLSDGKTGKSGSTLHIMNENGSYALLLNQEEGLLRDKDLPKDKEYILRSLDGKYPVILITGELLHTGIEYGAKGSVIEAMSKEKQS